MTSVPPPRAFFNEYLALPENRINVALFGLMLIPTVRLWLLDRLGLQRDCTVYPPQDTSGLRPDLVVVSEQNCVVAWIEIELGSEDATQLSMYRVTLAEPVKSIVGVKDQGDLCLQEIADHVTGLDHSSQEAKNAEVFIELVRSLAGVRANYAYTMPNDQLLSAPLVSALAARLGVGLRFGVPPVYPGTALISTITNKGWTLRVYSRVSGSVSLLWDQSLGLGRIRIPSRVRLDRCLPLAHVLVNDYDAFLAGLGCSIGGLKEAQSSVLAEGALLVEIDGLCQHIGALAGISDSR